MTGEEFKVLRKAAGLTQQALGNMAGTSRRSIAKYEAGDIDLSQIEGMDMKYRVYAGIGGRGHKWHPYSVAYNTADEAEASKQRAEARGILDLYNRPIKYIIREELGE